MQIKYSHCCGLDVHKKSATACVLVMREGRRQVRIKHFETHAAGLQRLMLWLYACKVTHVGNGIHGRLLEASVECAGETLPTDSGEPYQVKCIPTEKTDPGNAEWLADLLAHGLIRPSFVPPREIRQLRDLTRHRVKLVQERNRVHTRIHKVLEDASIQTGHGCQRHSRGFRTSHHRGHYFGRRASRVAS